MCSSPTMDQSTTGILLPEDASYLLIAPPTAIVEHEVRKNSDVVTAARRLKSIRILGANTGNAA
jgi:hypothetical protein